MTSFSSVHDPNHSLQVKSAEAEAEAKYLSGVGVAKQRKAIVDGLRTSIVVCILVFVWNLSDIDSLRPIPPHPCPIMISRSSYQDFSDGVRGASSKDVMDLLLLTQYFDCIKEVGSSKNCKTTFVPSGATSGASIRNSLLIADSAKLS
jgi:hypothetical protein